MTVIAVVLATACVDTPPMAEPVIESSHIAIRVLPESRIPKGDLLVYVDDSVAMAEYRDRIPQLAELVADRIERMADGLTDVRVAVVSNDGVLRTVPGTQSKLLQRATDFEFRVWKNYAEPLEDVLGEMMMVATLHDGAPRPLEAIRHALETSSQFLREDAGIAILIVSAADDASPWPVVDYAMWLNAIVNGNWRRPLRVSAIAPSESPRLDALFADDIGEHPPFHVFGTRTSIDALDFTRAIEELGRALVGGWGRRWICIDSVPQDRDPLTPGNQYDCSLSVAIDDEIRPVPACVSYSDADMTVPSSETHTSGACWKIVENDQCYPTDVRLAVELRGYGFAHPALRLECRAR